MNARPLIVGIGGTTREGSSTEQAMRTCLQAAARQGAEVALLTGSELLLPMYSPTDVERTPQARRLVDLVRRCDGLVIGSPGYHGTISGLVKNALDYTEDLRDDARPYLDGRAVACIACAAGWQATGSTLSALRSIVHALRGWPTPLGVTINTGPASPPGQPAWAQEPVRRQLEALGGQVMHFARMTSLAAPGSRLPLPCAA